MSKPGVSYPSTDPAATEHAVEQERLRIADDLHDDLGNLLIAVKMALRPIAQGQPADDAVLQAAAGRADRLLDQSLEAMYRILHDLRPPELGLGLVGALQQVADDCQANMLPCRFASNRPDIDAPAALTLNLLRICREALTNIGKHAGATRVELHLTLQEAGAAPASLWLDIIDDGHGCAPGQAASASIRRRVEALGGTLERRDEGRHLHIAVPWHAHDPGLC
ncbi:MAG: histidine kinase [Herbaspirillum sp.]|jgi:signal transduction histidine kinase|nr:histidine kinase [Herbaspirillum sp.]